MSLKEPAPTSMNNKKANTKNIVIFCIISLFLIKLVKHMIIIHKIAVYTIGSMVNVNTPNTESTHLKRFMSVPNPNPMRQAAMKINCIIFSPIKEAVNFDATICPGRRGHGRIYSISLEK